MKSKLLRVLKKTVMLLAATSIGIFVVINTPQWHHDYLEHKVGRVVIKALKDESKRSGGTGFHVVAPSGKTYIITNAHVCGKSIGNIVYVSRDLSNNPSRLLPRRIIDMDEAKDLCLIEAYGELDGISVASSVERGALIWIIGHPRLNDLTISFGMLINMNYEVTLEHAKNTTKEDCDKPYLRFVDLSDSPYSLLGIMNVCLKVQYAYQSNSVIHPGNSGSPAVNVYGNLIGVAFAGDSARFSYIIKLEDVKDFLNGY